MKELTPKRDHLALLGQLIEKAFTADLRGKTVILVDYPLYNNVGDWLIYHGTLALLGTLGCHVERQYCRRNYNRLLSRKLPKDWVILLQGGGNFGDLYPSHQTLRKDVIQAFPDNKIIMMPQSIHFTDPDIFRQEASIYRLHTQLVMHVRDEPSYNLLISELPEHRVKLTPDMAMMLLGRWPWLPDGTGTLLFRRRDCEAAQNSNDADGFDWEDMFTPQRHRVIRQITRLANYEQRFNLNLGASACWQTYTQRLMRYAFARFSTAARVDTDRLHGMIFALLLGKPVILRDNSYGKIQRFTEAWFDGDSWLRTDQPSDAELSQSTDLLRTR